MTITKVKTSRRAHCALSRASATCAAALAAVAGIGVVGGSSRAQAEHIPYEIDLLGYDDAFHTRFSDTGNTRSYVGVQMNDVGHVIGNQRRYDGTADMLRGQTAWTFQDGMIRVGLLEGDYDGEYVRPTDQTQSSTAMYLNNAGVVAGESSRYFEAEPHGDAGKAAWVYQNGQSDRIGLYGAGVFRRSDGFESSEVKGLSDLGHVIGNSARYSGGNAHGASAWLNEPGSAVSINIDPAGAEYTRFDDQFKQSNALFITTVGDQPLVAGTSRRFHSDNHATSPGGNAGDATWVYNGGTTTKVGLTTGHYSSAAGVQSSTLHSMNQQGDVVGTSRRYIAGGNTDRGQMGFFHPAGASAGSSVSMGLTSAEHTLGNSTNGTDDSYRFTTVTKLNDHGVAVGHSNRYAGSTQKGQSGWIAPQGSADRIGLFDADGTGDYTGDGIQYTQVQHLNNHSDGHAAGFSNRYTPAGANRGQAAWVYNNGTTRVGLFFVDDYTKSDGTQYSDVAVLNNAGQVVGKSQRFDGADAAGYSAYFYSQDLAGGLPVRIGLFGSEDGGIHTASNGVQESYATHLNDAGQAAGFSFRYDTTLAEDAPGVALPSRGQSGWFYDDEADESHMLVFSRRNDGLATTSINFLTDNGVVLGSYTLYDGEDTVGNHAFFWDFNVEDDTTTALDERFHDLGDAVEGGLSATQWTALTSATGMSDFGHILGSGTWSDGISMRYLMTPIPEPTGLAMLALGGLALLPRRRR